MAGLSIVNIVATTLILAAVAANARVLIATDPIAAAGNPVAGNPLAHICDDMTFTKVCEGLKTVPGVTTPRSLLEAAVRVSLRKATAAKGKFAKAATTSSRNPMASILQSCTGSYDDLVNALEEAERTIQTSHGSSNYDDVVTKMTAASTFAGDCDNAFEERSMESPFKATQRQVARVVSIALGIAVKTKNL